MSGQIDYYELLQISPNAEPETIHRVYRLLAPRYHPDNPETGDARKFRQLHEAYTTLTDPVKRAQFDVVHERQRNDRWKLVSAGGRIRVHLEDSDLGGIALHRYRIQGQNAALHTDRHFDFLAQRSFV